MSYLEIDRKSTRDPAPRSHRFAAQAALVHRLRVEEQLALPLIRQPINPKEYYRHCHRPKDPRHVDWHDPAHLRESHVMNAVRQNDVRAVRALLLKNGASPFGRDATGQCLVGIAINDNNNVELARFLREFIDSKTKIWNAFFKRYGPKARAIARELRQGLHLPAGFEITPGP